MLLFQTLSRREMLDFDRFLKGLYPQHDVCHAVFDYCRRHLDRTDPRHWDKELAFAEIFREETDIKNKRKKLTDALSDLNLLLQEFLLWQKSRHKSFERSFAVLKIYKERKLHELLLSGLKQLRRQLEKQKAGRTVGRELQMMQLAHLEFYEAPIQKFKLKENPLHRAVEHLISFFRTTLLKYACEVANRAYILQERYEIDGLEEILKKPPSSGTLQHLYHDFYLLLRERGRENFVAAKELLFSRRDLSAEDVEVCLTYLINLGIQFSKEGNLFFTKELLDLYRYGLKNRIFLIDNKLQSAKFLNTIELACKAGEIPWTKDFMAEYESYLPRNERTAVMTLARAIIAFAKEEYASVLLLLRELQPVTVEHEVRARALTLCAMFEQAYDANVILDYCESFNRFLLRNNVIGRQTREGFQNLAKMVRQLALRNQPRRKLELTLENAEAIYMKYWLQKQIGRYSKL